MSVDNLAEQVVEVVVGADPDPLDDVTLAIADCTNVQRDSD